MTIPQMERLIKTLRANGVEYFKNDDIEIRLKAVESQTTTAVRPDPASAIAKPAEHTIHNIAPRGTGPLPSEPTVNPTPAAAKDDKNPGDIKPAQLDIKHHVNEMVSVMKMGPEELLDIIFPLPGEEKPNPEQAAA